MSVPHIPRMSRRTSSAELSALIAQVLDEARSGSGTWSLRTYADLRKVIEGFSDDMAREFADSVVTAIFDEDTPTTRYKLAQMCTILRSLKPPMFEQVFQQYQADLETKYKEIEEADDIGHSTVKLLKSLFQELAKRRASANFRTSFLIKEPKICTQMNARTPDPNTNEILAHVTTSAHSSVF